MKVLSRIFDETHTYKYKLMILFSCLIGVMLNCKYGFMLPSNDIDSVLDYSFYYTNDINIYLRENQTIKNCLIIASSFFIDGVVIMASYYWLYKTKSFRFIISLLVFFLIRYLTQSIFLLKYPDGYLWDYPGFPSLSVSYLKTNDFFFSGHVGVSAICAFEFKAINFRNLFYVSLLCSLFQAITMIVTRGHYSIDIIFGFIIAHYVFIMIDYYKEYYDSVLIKEKLD